jgi:hypothetical protein
MKRSFFVFLTAMLCTMMNAQNQTYNICQGAGVTVTANMVPGLTNMSFSIQPGGSVSTSNTFVVNPVSSTAYTLYTSGNNGMSNVTFTNTAMVNVYGATSFNMNGTPGLVLGCSTKSSVVLSASNFVTNPQGAGVTLTLMAPGSGAVPSGSLSTASAYTVTAPGTYTFVVRDNSAGCSTQSMITVTQNTMSPVLDSVIFATQVLNCFTPSVELKAFSNVTNVSFLWTWPSANLAGSNITVNANFAVPTQTLIANYTLTLTDNVNLCQSSTVIPVFQNLFRPIAKIGNTGSLTCITSSIELTNQSSTGIPPGPFPNNVVIGLLWQGPSPSPTLGISSSYTATMPGVHTLTVRDQANGCTSVATTVVGEDRLFPLINMIEPPPVFFCGNVPVVITPNYATSTVNLSYTWAVPPTGQVAAVNAPTLMVNSTGVYTLWASGANGCTSEVTMTVQTCTDIDAHLNDLFSVFPNPAREKINIRMSDSQSGVNVSVLDVCGRVMYSGNMGSSQEIGIEHLAPGVYFVRIEDEGKVIKTAKLIRE